MLQNIFKALLVVKAIQIMLDLSLKCIMLEIWTNHLHLLSQKENLKKPKRLITHQELARHSTEEDCWVLLNGIVYDVTGFLAEHPGGPNVVTNLAGDDVTEAFNEQGHSENAKEIAKKFEIGTIDPNSKRLGPKKKAGGGMAAKDWVVLLVGLAIAIGIAVYFNLPKKP